MGNNCTALHIGHIDLRSLNNACGVLDSHLYVETRNRKQNSFTDFTLNIGQCDSVVPNGRCAGIVIDFPDVDLPSSIHNAIEVEITLGICVLNLLVDIFVNSVVNLHICILNWLVIPAHDIESDCHKWHQPGMLERTSVKLGRRYRPSPEVRDAIIRVRCYIAIIAGKDIVVVLRNSIEVRPAT